MNNGGKAPQSWKGKQHKPEVPTRFRWQSSPADVQELRLRSPVNALRRWVLWLLVLSIGMLALFVFLLLHAPIKTPLITVAATDYLWPLPPNAWVHEDVHGFSYLDGKTIQWNNLTDASKTKSTALEALKTQLRSPSNLAHKSGAIILYLSAHGAVNDEGLPCLIPAGANSLTPNQWITIEELASTVTNNVSSGIHVLLVLDCVHQRVNWFAAQLNNTFVERLEDWANASRPKNMFIVTSASQDENAWSGLELRSSIFGKMFRLGLSGAADQNSTRSQAKSGNGDGAVSLRELFDYVRFSVGNWVQDHRGTTQTPRIFPTDFADFRLAWSLKEWELERQLAEAQSSDLAPRSISIDQLGELWRTFEKLREFEVFRYDARNWVALERKLLWLDQISVAGNAYAELATKQVYPELVSQLNQSLERAKVAASNPNYVARANVLHMNVHPALLRAPLPSLALKELVGEVAPDVAAKLRQKPMEPFESGSSETFEQIMAASGLVAGGNAWNELNFVGLAAKYDAISVWSNRALFQEALALRDQCERLAVHGDVRGHRWKMPALDVMDRARRKVEDQLFIGPEDSQNATWTSLKQSIDAMIAPELGLNDRLETAWGLRDRGLAEVAYLAAWICSPDTDMDNLGEWLSIDRAKSINIPGSESTNVDLVKSAPFIRERAAIQILVRLIEGLHELGMRLANSTSVGDQELELLRDVSSRVHRDRESLNYLVQDHIQRALNADQDSKSTPRAITALLGLPFLAAEDRIALYRKLDKTSQAALQRQSKASPNTPISQINTLALQLQSKALQSELAANSNDGDQPSSLRYSDRMRNWEQHPLSTILQLKSLLLETNAAPELESRANEEPNRESIVIEAANGKLRRHYLSVLSFNAAHVQDWVRTAELATSTTGVVGELHSAGLADHFERALLPLCPIQPESSACFNFRDLAVKDLLIWYASRSLDDFYADANENLVESHTSEGFFERSARQSLEYSELISESSLEMQQAARAIQDRIAILGPIARTGLKASVKQGPPVGGSDSRQFDVFLQPTIASLNPEKAWNMPFPTGSGVALVRNPKGIVPMVRTPIPMPVSLESPPFALSCPPLDRSTTHEMVVVYRGHEFKSPMFVGQGILVDFVPKSFDSADVILFGDRQRQPSIVFILDCSWSMGEQMPVESVETRTTSRLDLAKQHVGYMIAQIASRPDARLGVRLFGHRLGWSRPADDKPGAPSGKTRILPQPAYPGSIPQDVVPSKDVEAIVPLGRFTPEMMGGLNAKLSKIVPWGQSPLYYAIIQTFKDFAADDDSTAKSIVVITDGDNFQFNASGSPGGEVESSTTIEEVERAWKTAKVPLFILGVGISESDTPNSRQVLQRLADQTKGKYYDIENGSDLLRALSEQLSLGVYQVSSDETVANAKSSAKQFESKLNSPIEFKGLPNQANSYTLTFQSVSKSFRLQGGESLEMYLRADGKDIIAKPYDRLSPRAGTLVRAGDSARMIARVHRPSQVQEDMNFTISVQDPDNHFTPRPSQLWIEITPVLGDIDPSHRTYIFYDVNYEPGTPVPVVSWNASNWPALATMADVRIWAKFEPTPVSQTVPLSLLRTDPRKYEEGIEIAGLEGASLRIHVLKNRPDSQVMEIQVIELHSEHSPGVGSLRVLLEANDIGLPVRVTRRFEAASRMAVHTFTFDSSLGAALLRSPEARISISSRAAVLDGAWQIEGGQSIRVGVAKASELLPLQSATGTR